MNSKRILITGGAGFIGSTFVKLLLRTGDYGQMRILDALTYAGDMDNLAGALDDPRVTFIHGDIANPEAAKKAMLGCNDVVHFAAETHVDRSLTAADPFLRTNIMGTYVLLETAREMGADKFVHISTDEVYGPMISESAKEDYPFNPSSPYSASKVGAEAFVNSYRVSFGLTTIIVRPANNYGPHQFPEKLIPFFVKRAVEGKTLPVYGEGLQQRDWLHVDDNCRAIHLVLREGKSGDVFNIGADNHHKNIDITRRIIEILDLPENRIEHVEDRLGHDFRYAVDSTRLINLGWQPEVPFERGFKETVLWFSRKFGG